MAVIEGRLYVDGNWMTPDGDGRITVVNPTTEQPIGTVPSASPADVDAAVVAAGKAFPDWAELAPGRRAGFLRDVALGLEARASELGDLITAEVGTPRRLSERLQVGLAVGCFTAAASLAEGGLSTEEIGNSLVVREPVGVVAAITPWNYPLYQVAAKVAYALAAGCTIVLKPSEVAPLSALALAQVMDDIGLPAGTFNLVTGPGAVVGEALVGHEAVDMVSFTGSTTAGVRVATLAAATVKNVALELGGKSANLLLDDLDDGALADAVRAGLNDCFLNSGQTCAALTRMLVPRERMAQVEELVAEMVPRFVVGDPFEPTTRLGPVVSAAQRARVWTLIDRGIEEGARLVIGGTGSPPDLDLGYFVRPTVFSDVQRDMAVAQEEIFGPVLCLLPYDDDGDAVAIANDSRYGLSGGVWAADEDRAMAVARRLRTGQVAVNGGAYNPLAPFGGFKQSGVGREYGALGLEAFLEVKAIQR